MKVAGVCQGGMEARGYMPHVLEYDGIAVEHLVVT
jgi:hypothetical protein